MKRRVLLVDDEVTILLTLKAVLEISGFDVDTAASAREGRSKLRSREYHMVITDMRMENEAAGAEVIEAARSAPYHPAVALLTAFPVADEDWQDMGADQMLVKPVATRILLDQIEQLLEARGYSKDGVAAAPARKSPARAAAAEKAVAPSAEKKAPARKTAAKKAAKSKAVSRAPRKPAKAAKKSPQKARRMAAKKARRG